MKSRWGGYAAFIRVYPSVNCGRRLWQAAGATETLNCAGVVWLITTGLTGGCRGFLLRARASSVVWLWSDFRSVLPDLSDSSRGRRALVSRGSLGTARAVGSTGLTLGTLLAQPLVAFVMVCGAGARPSLYPLAWRCFGSGGATLYDPADHAAWRSSQTFQANREQLTPDAGFGHSDSWYNQDTFSSLVRISQRTVFFYLFSLVLSLPGHRARLQYPRDRLSRLPSMAVRRGNGVGWRFYLRYPVCSSRTTPWMPHSRDHQAVAGDFSTSASTPTPPTAVALLSLCFASTQFTAVLTDWRDLCGRPLYRTASGVMNTSASCRDRGRAAHALFIGPSAGSPRSQRARSWPLLAPHSGCSSAPTGHLFLKKAEAESLAHLVIG